MVKQHWCGRDVACRSLVKQTVTKASFPFNENNAQTHFLIRSFAQFCLLFCIAKAGQDIVFSERLFEQTKWPPLCVLLT